MEFQHSFQLFLSVNRKQFKDYIRRGVCILSVVPEKDVATIIDHLTQVWKINKKEYRIKK